MNTNKALAHDNHRGNDHHAATPTRHPDCRALPTRLSRYIQPERDIPIQGSHSTRAGEEAANPSPPIKEETMTANEGNGGTEQPATEPEAPAATELQAAPQPAEPVAEQPPAEQAAEAAPTSDDAPTS
jgi:hypothetical protein